MLLNEVKICVGKQAQGQIAIGDLRDFSVLGDNCGNMPAMLALPSVRLEV